MIKAWRWTLLVACLLAASLVLAVAALAWKWRERPAVTELAWPVAESAGDAAKGVTVTWLGITTLLFDDGETQILTDGAFSRLSLFEILALRPVYSDMDVVNHALSKYRIDRLAAIVPLHSHFDHAMDVGHVANRTAAVVLGSESTANIARGAGVPVSQYQILASGESRRFGNFTITLIESRHAPLGAGGNPPFPGTIDEPLEQPARVTDWHEGGTWSVLINHPRGDILVQGSGGFLSDALPRGGADVVILGIAGLSRLGKEYVERYWEETVVHTGATRVFPVHYDDFTRPFGQITPFPYIVDDVSKTADWINELAGEAEPAVDIALLPFGQPVDVFPARQ
jgi:L-ascorbate metabolism protein UlaG (beta-lactamase superfamily)